MERADGGSLCPGPWQTGNITRESRIGVSGEDTGGYRAKRAVEHVCRPLRVQGRSRSSLFVTLVLRYCTVRQYSSQQCCGWLDAAVFGNRAVCPLASIFKIILFINCGSRRRYTRIVNIYHHAHGPTGLMYQSTIISRA